MRPSRFLAALFAGTGLMLSGAASVQADWFHHHRRTFQWLEPVVPAPEVKSEQVTPGTPMPQSTAEPPVSASPLVSAALGDDFLAVTQPGYLDSAIPMTQMRLRVDSGHNFNRPDRAEFFYPKCGCFGLGAPGPKLPEQNVDYQDVSLYLEYAASNRFSAFIEAPYRFLNPDFNENTSGISDLRVGVKAALIADDCQYLTFQFRTFFATGDGDRGLGTDHNSLEPSLLYWRKVGDRGQFFAQLGDWIPLGGTEFAGNVGFYGAGVAFGVVQNERTRVSPIVELLGWHVFDGKEFTGVSTIPPFQIRNAANTDILNAKLGVRVDSDRQSVYFGYGRAITGETWYQDIFRLEYRLRF